ncbi:putative MFS alpha-glucoside transporter [Talaromyces proteolyticus]|uniref:MFS alpha-glucoside transporter n=1 Tax=Talaromyces proteolyticus TaxID=1131652 RepID=A0AAD4L0H5_9EURO|nr:putative MFS alpha-glucoside transporter [Talaromyces proteolyticus]KAH8705318.1 putative MFS alpha-glucoside transporter [Talaromyces proteolyticus]
MVGIDSVHVQHVDGIKSPSLEETRSPDKGAVNVLLILACVAFGSASFLFGYDDKVISPVAALSAYVEKFQGPNPVDGTLVLTARNQNLVFSVPLVGSILGGLAASPLNSRYGRKWPLIAAYIFSLGGGLLQLFAPNLGVFVVGRFWSAITIGIANATAPLYMSEVVPPSMRGRSVTSINILSLISGVVSTVIVNATRNLNGKKQYMIPLAVQCALPIILIIVTIALPESPQWLVAKGRMEEARRNLRKLRGFSDWQVDDELRVMKLCEESERALTANVRFWEIFDRQNLKRTLTAGSFYSLNQISGVILSTTYTTVFLTELGVGNPFLFTVIASCCTLAGTIVAPLVIDRVGRRPTAFVGMTLLLLIDIAAGGLAFNTGNKNSVLGIAALGFIFNFFWGAGFYSLSALMPSEIATPKLRNHTMAYTIACAQTTAVITTFAVPQLTSADAANLGAKTYLVFAGCMACVLVFVYFFMPETKGRTFAEVDEMYDANIPMWKWRSYQTTTEAKQARIVVG